MLYCYICHLQGKNHLFRLKQEIPILVTIVEAFVNSILEY